MRDVERLEILLEGFRGDLHPRDGLHVLLQLPVGGVPALEPRPGHVFVDGEMRGVVPPVVHVPPHQGIDQQPVGRPGEVLRVLRHGLEDQRHLIVLVPVADVLVAVGVRLVIGHGDAVGRGVKLPAPLHVGPHAADEVRRRAVAQHVILLHPLGHGGLKDLQHPLGEVPALRGRFRHHGGDGLRAAEIVPLQIPVQHGIDLREVIGIHLVLEFPGMLLLQGLQLLIGGQHLLELLRLQKAQGRFLGSVRTVGGLRHGGGLL